ncbi:hypothetical protein A0J48_002370 [Sphaerospermopsis aphanizomenoides BCCUSP55]|uniref:hypothetical protein n=1 Tax=Sphaerospermopsis aphanizomenoides TaxID=459663 RepID=UPI001907B336|nr:hypothetical protein [Sphaerospermopsis aphanizomenoides]MBK1986405.1 hypothetical protein [Sphaerospermopsis aphanizomenoides BCCUSP55]
MNDITFFASLFFCSAIAIYLFWFVCHYNGKIILYFIHTDARIFGNKNTINHNNNESSENRSSMAKICLIGAMPLAILSISTAALNSCFNSVYATGILEIFLTVAFLFIPTQFKKEFDIFGIHIIKQNLALVFYTCLWCLIFAFWAVLNHHQSLDYMISNTNPDMWAYVRRFAAMTTDNLSFSGEEDTIFNGNSACAYLLGSPKKFSSFLGSLIVYPFNGSSLGIAVFQGMLGGTLLISLFKEWFDVKLSNRQGFSFGKLILITWVLFAPPLYWLLVSAYFSNTLFVIVICLTLRHCREIALACKIDAVENLVCLFAILTIVFAFYPAFLPVIIATYFIAIFIYLPRQNFDTAQLTQIAFKFIGVILGCGLFFYLVFPSQLGLHEVNKSLNLLDRHGSNFVPLNPWSLLQETPKPMPLTRDFGWYFHLSISLPFSAFLGWRIWQIYKTSKDKNLLAALVGVGTYGGYLLAFIPLEHTYRLMKIAISLIYPLAIFGLLPLILWWRNRLTKKSAWIKNGVLFLATVHTIFHIGKVFDLNTFPTGSFTLSNKAQLENVKSIVIVGCKDVNESQFYERLVGLQIARQYPNIVVNVFQSADKLNDSPTGDIFIYGKTIPDATSKINACHFSI